MATESTKLQGRYFCGPNTVAWEREESVIPRSSSSPQKELQGFLCAPLSFLTWSLCVNSPYHAKGVNSVGCQGVWTKTTAARPWASHLDCQFSHGKMNVNKINDSVSSEDQMTYHLLNAVLVMGRCSVTSVPSSTSWSLGYEASFAIIAKNVVSAGWGATPCPPFSTLLWVDKGEVKVKCP